MKRFVYVSAILALSALPLLPRGYCAPPPATLISAGYDGSQAFFDEFNPLFVKTWKGETGQDVTVTMAFGDSAAQAGRVLGGLEADCVAMSESVDIDRLADRGHLLPKEWRTQFPERSVPFTSTILFVVRAGNPKSINDWADLARPGVRAVIANPKTSGSGRYAYLAAWAYALRKHGGDENTARNFVKSIFETADVLDAGSRALLSGFTQHEIGDVLVTYENEAYAIENDPTLGTGKFQVVVPPMSIRVEPVIATVSKNSDTHRTRAIAEAYGNLFYRPAAQEIAAKCRFRPSDKDVLAEHADLFKPLEMIDVETVFGNWEKAQAVHFADGAVFDQIYHP